MSSTRLNLSVTSDNPEIIARAAEQFARAVSGLALDGVSCFLMAGPDEDDSDGDEE